MFEREEIGDAVLYRGDCLEVMATLPDGCVDAVVTSPPYDSLRKYEGFSFDFKSTAAEIKRLLKAGCAMVWVVGDQVKNGGETGTSFKQALHFKKIGLNLHDTMIWHKPNPVPTQNNRYESAFEFMFVFSKGKPATTNILKEGAATAGLRMSKHRSTGGAHEYNTEGAYTVGDRRIRHNVWVVPVGGVSTGHPAVYPVRLAQDHVLSWTNEGDTVLDPFVGSGTTGVAALQEGRKFVGCEISKKYFDIACRRIEEAQRQQRLFA